MVSDILALLKYLVIYMNMKQGSSPDRGQSPVECIDFLFVGIFVCPPLWAIQPGLRPSQPGLVRTYVGKISPFYRTSSPIGAAALLPKGSSRPIKSRAREPLTI